MEAAAMLEELAAAWGCMAEVVEDDRSSSPTFVHRFRLCAWHTDCAQLPFQVGWQDLKDLFRQAGES